MWISVPVGLRRLWRTVNGSFWPALLQPGVGTSTHVLHKPCIAAQTLHVIID
jgi:hypothetical protein